MIRAIQAGQPTDDLDGLGLIDCDVHVGREDKWLEDLMPYWSRSERAILTGSTTAAQGVQGGTGRKLPRSPYYAAGANNSTGPGADDAAEFAVDLLDRNGIDRAIVLSRAGLSLGVYPQAWEAVLIARAANNWITDRWLGRDHRWRGLITVAPQSVEWSIKEIERCAKSPNMVGIYLPLTSDPMGAERLFPIFAAAVASEFPVVIHSSAAHTYANGPRLMTAINWLDYRYSGGMPVQLNIATMVTSGAFETFPDLKVLCADAGFAWLGPTMWTLDDMWKASRSSAPWVKRPPSDYIHKQCWVTTQPWISAPNDEQLAHALEMSRADTTLVFGSDYPHSPHSEYLTAIQQIPVQYQRAVRAQNALALFGKRLM